MAPGRRTAVVSVGYTVLGVLPLFLISSQSVQLQREFGFDTAQLGLAVSICFVASAIAANVLSRVVPRIGPSAGFKLSALLSLSALLWMVTVASRWWHIAVALVLCGVANATSQVASNVALAGGVPAERHGLAFGAKQAAVPLASLTAGLMLPAVALLAGWRAAFIGTAVVVLGAVIYKPRLTARPPQPGGSSSGRPTALLVLLALAGLLGGTMGNSLPAFTVDSAAARGIGEGSAGVLLAVGSAASVLVRLAAGWIADRRRSSGLTELTALMAVGILSFGLLAASEGHDLIFAVGIVAGFAGAWGWQGLIYSAAVHTHPGMPAAATGFILSTIYVGHVLGPVTIGLLAEHRSYTHAWIVACGALVLATAAGLRARSLEQPGGSAAYSPASDPVGS